MAGRLERIPLLVLLIGLTGLAMLLPAGQALVLREHAVARAFFYPSLLVVGLAALLALATAQRRRGLGSGGLLPTLAAVYLVLPAAMALPLAEALPEMRLADAWFEMVACFTTTGATLIDTPRRVPAAVHLWRALAGWAGGLFVLVSAMAFLAPLRLGGFELLRPAPEGTQDAVADRQIERQRLRAAAAVVVPWYAGLTGAIWLALAMGGMPGFPALILAMSAISTSGILPRESLGDIGFVAEAVLFAAMALSLSHALAVPARGPGLPPARRTLRDPELRLAAVAVAAVAGLVVVRHWLGAFETAEGEDLPALGGAAWGAVFTGLSFLTTTGFVSYDWIVARAWSGLTPPGLVLVGLALIGGGVATTAGGVKLLRVYAMARLGRSELERLVHPRMVEGGDERMRFLAGPGARAALLFAMVFAIVAVALVGALLALGLSLEDGLIFTVAALTTTGPLVQVAGDAALAWSGLDDAARALLALGMILGRLEILVILALVLGQLSRG